jgi:Co/Zn/Cd efflux system component
VGEVVGVVSTLGAVTMVSLCAGAGSIGSLALVSVTVGVVVDASSFILALILVGGINSIELNNVQVGSEQAGIQ